MRAWALAVVALLLAGCASASDSEPVPGASGTVTVFAASSLTEAFAELAAAFNEENPGVEIVLSFGGSSTLATQIVEGAPVDVFAAASPATMATVADAALTAGDPVPFASNTLEIAVPAGNPGAVDALDDFANPDLLIALCAVEVPCGSAAHTVLTAAGITPSVDTYEQDVKAVLSKVELGEVDAGLVYRTDVIAGEEGEEGVEGVEFAEAADAVSLYPIAALTDSEAAAAFVAFVLSATGQAILAAAGFGPA